MKNRPLCSLCLVIAILIGILTAGAGAKFVSELRPSPVEQYGEKDDWLIVRGQVYKKEEKEKYQILYLKKCSVYFQKDQQSQQNQQSQQSLIKEPRMLIYDEKKNKIQIGNEVEAEGKLSFFETARNPGNFNQKAYYQRQNIHGKVWSETLRITDHTVKRIQNVLENIRVHCRNTLLSEAGEKNGSILSTILLGEKSQMDTEIKKLYQVNGIGHILAISGVKTLKLDIPLVPETSIKWALMPLHIAKIYILKLCLDEEIIPRCRFPCSRGYFKKCINWQNKKSFSVSQSYRKSLKNQQKEKKPMAYKKYREMKVYEASGYQYKRTPSIVLKGQWLSELGFDIGDQIEVKCEDGRLIITKANEIWQCE